MYTVQCLSYLLFDRDSVDRQESGERERRGKAYSEGAQHIRCLYCMYLLGVGIYVIHIHIYNVNIS